MRIILSRKGFDSSAGGVASPIFPDGSMVSLPIPERDTGVCYGDLAWRGEPLAPVIEQLTKGNVPARFGVHMDPDLEVGTLPRSPGWRPSLGQVGAAQTVLSRAGVGPSDLFLFFGWFRQVAKSGDTLRYVRGSPQLHVLFGWLQVGEVISLSVDTPPTWASGHPHVTVPDRTHNTLYVAADHLSLGGTRLAAPGAGVFQKFRSELCLTMTDQHKRSCWDLPGWMLPADGKPTLGYHGDKSRWTRSGDRVQLDSVPRAQEFVLDVGQQPKAMTWIRELIHGRTA